MTTEERPAISCADLARSLASRLGGVADESGEYTGVTADQSYGRIVLANGCAITFRRGYGCKTGVEVHAWMPDLWRDVTRVYRLDYGLSIGVSLYRPADDFYREIERRLWPRFKAAYQEGRRRYAESQDAAAMLARNVAEMAAILKLEPHRVHSQADPALYGHYGRGDDAWYCKVTGSSYKGGTWAFDLHSVPHDLACAIARTIADYEGAR